MSKRRFVRWTIGEFLLIVSSAALGASQSRTHGLVGSVIFGALVVAALLAQATAILTFVRHRRPQLTTTAVALIVLTFAGLVLLADGPLLPLILGSANFVIAFRVLRMAILRDRYLSDS